MLLPCKHVVGCMETAKLAFEPYVDQCSECRSGIDKVQQIFFPQ